MDSDESRPRNHVATRRASPLLSLLWRRNFVILRSCLAPKSNFDCGPKSDATCAKFGRIRPSLDGSGPKPSKLEQNWGGLAQIHTLSDPVWPCSAELHHIWPSPGQCWPNSGKIWAVLSEVCRSMIGPGQLRPKPPKFGRVRAEVGRARAKVDRFRWPFSGQIWSKCPRIRSKFGRCRVKFGQLPIGQTRLDRDHANLVEIARNRWTSGKICPNRTRIVKLGPSFAQASQIWSKRPRFRPRHRH